MKSLSDRLAEYIAGGFSAIWVQSHEPADACTDINLLCKRESWTLARWDIDQGLRINGQNTDENDHVADPLTAIKSAQVFNDDAKTSILVLENFHRFMSSAEIVQTMINQIQIGKFTRTFLIILAPVVDLPVELEKLFVIVEHEMPSYDQLLEIAREIATNEEELPDGVELKRILDAAGGLTRYEAESAYSLSLVRHGKIQADAIWELKCQMLKKSGLIDLYSGNDDFGDLGGLTNLKSFTKRALIQPAKADAKKRPRGVLLISPPGCGKSQFCKALGKEVGRPVLILDVGSLMGSLVGQSEQRTRQAIRIIDAMAPCIAMIDEVEKAFAGVSGSGQTDSGVSSRMFGTFLSWLNDHTTDVFVVCTANDVTKLPPEFSRAERFDAVYFLDLPTDEEKNLIWELYIEYFELDANQKRPNDKDWTGAEIKACCRLSALLDVPLNLAGHNVVPVAATSAESISKLRSWANGRCLDATVGGIYNRNALIRQKQETKSAGLRPSTN